MKLLQKIKDLWNEPNEFEKQFAELWKESDKAAEMLKEAGYKVLSRSALNITFWKDDRVYELSPNEVFNLLS